MEEEYTVIFGNLQDGIYRVVTGFDSEEDAFEYLEDEGEDGFVIESETFEPDDEYDDEDLEDEEDT
tara:strand:- start:328 stop:525 length:198 start_codon:yes stop_codon:yes gene_type:complete